MESIYILTKNRSTRCCFGSVVDWEFPGKQTRMAANKQ